MAACCAAQLAALGLVPETASPAFALRRPGQGVMLPKVASRGVKVTSTVVGAAPVPGGRNGAMEVGTAAAPLARFLAGAALPEEGEGRGFTCVSYNVLLPNGKDGWWIYKYYRDPGPDGEFAMWPARQVLLKQQLLTLAADVVCLQEASDLSFDEDFAFLFHNGYQGLMHEKNGRMRPATFWRDVHWELISALHKDRILVVALRRRGGVCAGATIFVCNAHLSAGTNADRRLRQAHEALEAIAKEAKRLALDFTKLPVVFCGDMNSQGRTAVREILLSGEVSPDFRESGDPTEKGQEGKQITSKVKRHSLGRFEDAVEACFGQGNVPATILAANVDSKMVHDDGTLTTAALKAIGAAFEDCCAVGQEQMRKEDVDRWLVRINKEVGRGSEYRSAMGAMEQKAEAGLTKDDFKSIYAAELAEGKFWGVEHDLRVLGGNGLAVPSEGPCELCFDHMFYTPATLRLVGVQEPLTEEQKQRIWGEPWEILPNAWHPSDHLPVAAAFLFP